MVLSILNIVIKCWCRKESWNHSTIYFGRDIQRQSSPTPSFLRRWHHPLIRLVKAPSNLILNSSRNAQSTISLGNLFQCLPTLIKNFFRTFSLNLPSFILKLLLLIVSLEALVKSLFHRTYKPPLYNEKLL